MRWLNLVREPNDFIFGLRVSENEEGKYEDCKGKWIFGSREMEIYGSTVGLECVENGKIGICLVAMV